MKTSRRLALALPAVLLALLAWLTVPLNDGEKKLRRPEHTRIPRPVVDPEPPELPVLADPRVRVRELRSLASESGRFAREALQEVVGDEAEHHKVRAAAARWLGRTGPGALVLLEGILAADLPERVRAGAVLGLGELRTANAAQRALEIAGGPPSRLRTAALRAVYRMSTAESAGPLLLAVEGKGTPEDVRRVACRALGESRLLDAIRPLVMLLEDARAPAAVRAAAADALGRAGHRDAIPALAAARGDGNRAVAREARVAWTRLSHVW